MSLKLKALGLGLLATLAMSAMALTIIDATTTTNASAETGGHFTTDDTSGHTILEGEDKAGNTTLIIDHSTEREFYCIGDVKYHGTITAQTVTEITFTPTFPTGAEGCRTRFVGEEKEGTAVTIHMNGCDYLFTIGKTFSQHNTTHLKCPSGKAVEVTVPGPFGTCTLKIKPQTPSKGSGYYKGAKEHEITIKPTLEEIHVEYLGGFFTCGVANGTTTMKTTLDNRISLKAFTTAGTPKGITATGPED